MDFISQNIIVITFFGVWFGFALIGLYNKWSIIISFGGGLFLAFIAIMIPLKMEEDKKSFMQTNISATTQEDLSLMAVIHCKDFVKRSLVSPATADFPFFDFKAWGMGNDTYVVKSYVDSQNRLGATIRSNWHCKAKYNGGLNADIVNWTLLDLEIM